MNAAKFIATLVVTLVSGFALAAGGALGPGGGAASAGLYAMNPPLVVEGADPFLMIDLSVELTQQAEGFTDGAQVYAGGTVCPGRADWNGQGTSGVCFKNTEEYIGYFDANKCYTYSNGVANVTGTTAWKQRAEGPYPGNGLANNNLTPPRFVPVRKAVNHICGGAGEYSGNFLNWSTMTALDEFRSAMTGGARLVDTAGAAASTILVRTYRYDDWAFVQKVISSRTVTPLWARAGTTTFATNIRDVTPWGSEAANATVAVRIRNDVGGPSGNRVNFYLYNAAGTQTAQVTNSVNVEVCKKTGAVDPETNCVAYSDAVGNTTWYKPEGLMQKNALKMRYALTSYTGDSGNTRNGGVLRANAKYVGVQRPTVSGGLEPNPDNEINADGTYRFNPDAATVVLGNGVVNSGIFNYINQFGLAAGAYKSNDPVAELYYEGLRYIKGVGRTASFGDIRTGQTAAQYNTIKDGYPIVTVWTDPYVYGGKTLSCQKAFALYVGDQFAWADNCLPGGVTNFSGLYDTSCPAAVSGAAVGFNAASVTNQVGVLQGMGASLSTTDRGRGNGYAIAGLAYWANTNDVRPDISGVQRVKTYMVDTQEYNANPPAGQNNNLWLAAKFGGFEDVPVNPNNPLSGDKAPQLTEWDADNNGVPDTYTLASQPLNMVKGLTQAFDNVNQSTSAAAAAAVVANNSFSVGTIYQALYEPRLTGNGTAVIWTGAVRAFFLDEFGQQREDTDGDGVLTNADNIITYGVDASGATVANLTTAAGATVANNVSIRSLKPIWNAATRLSALSNAQAVGQRVYGTNAANGRYIFTWLDLNNNGVVDAGEQTDFVAANFPPITVANNDAIVDNSRYLGFDSTNGAQAGSLVDYIRGADTVGKRNRTIDPGDGGGFRTLRLGDVVNSAPWVVGPPQETYDVDFADASYAAFKAQYANRPQVVYVGANDGMLHAFNAGTFNPSAKTYNGGANALGSELWAYVPFNLLPHLRWLADTQYSHTFYVDGSAHSYDVNIFPNDADHPGGWGTILVVGFRTGGGEITVNSATDQVSAADAKNQTLRPAYVVMDITNPANPPTLLAEISDPLMGYSLSQPTVIKNRAGGANQWYLVIGSGPIGIDAGTDTIAHDKMVSYRPARIYLYDLNAKQLVYNNNLGGENNSFVGDMSHMDWNADNEDEAVYFGTISGTDTSNPSGNLWRLVMPNDFSANPGFSQVLAGANQPFSAAPLPTFDRYHRPWLYAGTGRFYSSADILSSKQNSMYGIKETNIGATTNKGNLTNATGIMVFKDGRVSDSLGNTPVNVNGQNVSTFSQLQANIDATSGWYFDLSSAAARMVDRLLLLDSTTLLFVEYTASNNTCDPSGSSVLVGPNLLTGTASPFGALGLDAANKAVFGVGLGAGQSFLSGIFRPANMKGVATIITQNNKAEVKRTLGFPPPSTAVNSRMSWRELPLPQ